MAAVLSEHLSHLPMSAHGGEVLQDARHIITLCLLVAYRVLHVAAGCCIMHVPSVEEICYVTRYAM